MRILGIDIGRTSVKAVELDSAFGRYEIREYYDQKIDPESSPASALRALMQGLPKAPDRIAVSMRPSLTTFRNLQLPTRDKKAIQSSVGFELDDDLPFPIEEAVYDYSILGQTGASTHVHVATTLRKHMESELELWRSAGIEPDMVTTEAWAGRVLFNRMFSLAAQTEPMLLVNIGEERTTLYLHWQGRPVLSRELQWGGRDITQAISSKYQLPMDQAERMKLDHGFVLPPSHRANATQEQIDFSETQLQPIEELIRHLRQTELTCKNVTHQNLSAIFLSGGSSLLPGMAGLIEEELQIPVQPLQALSRIATSGVTYSEQTDAIHSTAIALALCFVGPDRSLSVNFRKGQFSKQGRSRELNLSTLRRPLMAVGAVTASLVLSLIIQGGAYKSRLNDMDDQLTKSIRTFFGQVSSSSVRNYLKSPTSLRNSIDKELKKSRELARLLGPNPQSPLDFLKSLSSTIPKDAVVDLLKFQVGASSSSPYSPSDPSDANLTFVITNPQVAERVSTLLSERLNSFERSKMEETDAKDGSGKRWKVTFSGKPKEDFYGR